MKKFLGELNNDEFNNAVKDFDTYIVEWMEKHNIKYGSHSGGITDKTRPYDLYNSIKNAIRDEYKKATSSKNI